MCAEVIVKTFSQWMAHIATVSLKRSSFNWQRLVRTTGRIIHNMRKFWSRSSLFIVQKVLKWLRVCACVCACMCVSLSGWRFPLLKFHFLRIEVLAENLHVKTNNCTCTHGTHADKLADTNMLSLQGHTGDTEGILPLHHENVSRAFWNQRAPDMKWKWNILPHWKERNSLSIEMKIQFAAIFCIVRVWHHLFQFRTHKQGLWPSEIGHKCCFSSLCAIRFYYTD